MTRYSLQRRPKGSRYSDIEDPAFRSRVISFAATGMSRRGVAAAVGKSEATIRGWVERGMAHPGVEPWGSFAVDYRRAERGIEGAAASTVAMTVQMLHELAKRALGGDELALEQLAKQGPQMRELLNVLAARFPEDWGTSSHRVPEPEYSGDHWLEAHGLQSEQLCALFDDPPEAILNAMVQRSDKVYELLAAAGCQPPGKAASGEGDRSADAGVPVRGGNVGSAGAGEHSE